MADKIIEISSHPKYYPIVDETVLIIYNSYHKKKDLDLFQQFEYRSAVDTLRRTNAGS